MKMFKNHPSLRAKRSNLSWSAFSGIARRALKSEAGYALPLALILLLLGSFLVVPTLTLTTTSLNANQTVDENTLELYAADAGVENALWHVQHDAEFTLPDIGQQLPVPPPEGTINDRTVNVTISNEDGQNYKITSIATSADGDTTTIECYLSILGSSDVWDYALASLGGNITLSGNSEIESDEVLGGDIYSNGNINVSGNAGVDGNASAAGDITVTQNGDINGDQTEGAAPLVAPVINTAYYKSEAQNIGCENIICGDITHTSLTIQTNQSFPSRVHVQNDLTIKLNSIVTFQDTVCVNGNLNIEGNANVTFLGPVKVGGTLTISSNAKATFNGLVCVTGDLSTGSNTQVTFNGPVSVGNTLTLSSNYDTTFGSTLFVGGNLSITSNIDVFLGGTVYVVGSITVSGNANLIGGEMVFAETGDIWLSGNSKLNADNIPFIMAINGNVTVTGNTDTSAIIYAPEGAITLSGNCKLYGCAVGESVTGSGNSTVEYPMDLRNGREDLPGRGTGPGSGTGLQIRTFNIQKPVE
jgi:cytoskeletal protein CcmA (bactofilin family)